MEDVFRVQAVYDKNKVELFCEWYVKGYKDGAADGMAQLLAEQQKQCGGAVILPTPQAELEAYAKGVEDGKALGNKRAYDLGVDVGKQIAQAGPLTDKRIPFKEDSPEYFSQKLDQDRAAFYDLGVEDGRRQGYKDGLEAGKLMAQAIPVNG